MYFAGPLRTTFLAFLIFSMPAQAATCFGGGVIGTVKGVLPHNRPQTVALSRKLPPVVDLAGSRVKIVVSRAASVKDDPVDIMSTKLRAVLLKDRGRGISLDDPHPSTELRCRVTSFEITQEKSSRQVGNDLNTYTIVIGNMETTVEVFDLQSGRALDSENLKDHYEKWFLTGVTQNKSGLNLSGLGKKPKTEERAPTPAEQVSAVVEGMADKIAQRLVPIDDRFDVDLPVGFKEFKDIESYAKAGNWGMAKETAETMPPLPKAEEDSCRLYLVGLASEAIAYSEKDPQKAQDLLVNAASAYEKAKESNKSEERFDEPISRAQQSLERYITLDKMARTSKGGTQSRGASRIGPAASTATNSPPAAEPVGAAAKLVYDNQYLIKLKNSKASDQLILSEIEDADPAQFDISPNGIEQLTAANFSDAVIIAVKNKMRHAARPAAKVQAPAKKKN